MVTGNVEDLQITARFLQTQLRQVIDPQGNKAEKIEIGEKIFETWEEVVERNIETEKTSGFTFAESLEEEILPGKAKIIRSSKPISGLIDIEKHEIKGGLNVVTVRIFNHSKEQKFISVHLIMTVENAEFISLLEYESEFEAEVKALQQKSLFPVLVEKNTMLASPIILYDFPKVAPESGGDFFDATEIDEILTLRILTMTDEEKREAMSLDKRAKKIFELAEKTQLMDLHGVFRDELPGIGQKVRLKPKKSADAFDIFLENQIALVKSIREDFEGNKHFEVVLESDDEPNFGFHKSIGHRFFFSRDELEIL